MENNQENTQNIIPDAHQQIPPMGGTHIAFAYIIGAICFMLLILAALYFYLNRASPFTKSKIQRQIPATLLHPTSSTINKFSHKSLPGFMLDYPSSWEITTIKDFLDENSKEFLLGSLKACKEHCMGVRFSKSTVSLDLVFTVTNPLELVADSANHKEALICSNSVTSQSIGNGWYRLKDTSNYFYARSVTKNKTLKTDDIPFLFGKSTDEWSALPDIEYSICVSGWGDWLIEKPELNGIEAQEFLPILMEFPVVKGLPDDTSLTELDTIVSSIGGLK